MTDPDFIHPDITQIGQRTAGIMRAITPTVEITPPAMLERAIAQNAPIEVLERLIVLKERWDATEARKAFDSAFAAAKAETPVILKTEEVSFGAGKTSYKYEDLAKVLQIVDEWLAKFGMFVRFRTSSEPGQPVRVTCIVAHEKGHREENTLTAPPDTSGSKSGVQAIGSAVTYLSRYTLKAALGLAAAKDDDDARNNVISDEQDNAIRQMLVEAKVDVNELLQKAAVASISDIPAPLYDRVMDWLKRRKEALKQQEAADE